MNLRCILHPARAGALLLMFGLLFLASARSQAQVVDCTVCDHFTIGVSSSLSCPVTICYLLSPVAQPVCTTVTAGGEIRIPCPVYQVWVNTCSGPYSIIPASSTATCSPLLKFAVGCCAKICSVPGRCPRLEITPEPCSSLGCP